MKREVLSSALIDWFWAVGHQRQGQYALGTGTWLDRAYRIKASAETVSVAQAAKRRCVALWGPSQAGKSTLLSRYLDSRPSSGSAEDLQSTLQWTASEPVVFLGREDTPPNCVQLNPYNQGSDASGCVSRFTLKEEVPDHLHPVELRLATEPQLLHSLAIGFLSECDQHAGAATEVFLDQHSIEAMLGRYTSASPSPISRAAYERLRAVADILEDLAGAGWPRYTKLATFWNSLRPRILSHPVLLSDPALVDDFAAKLFWKGEENLTLLFNRLCQLRRSIQEKFHGNRIFCSYRVARLFLNIGAYQDVLSKSASEAQFDIRHSVGHSCVLLDHTAPNKLFASLGDFGLWQGLVWELLFAVNADTIKASAPQACEFFRDADLLDFPGVALAMPGGVKKAASEMTQEQLLTTVLKRGKTGSVVACRARELGIDGFCLLIRMCTPPAQPDQLLHGVKTWLNAYGLPLPPPAREVPLNLVLTFGAKVVNDEVFARRNKLPKGNFDNVFSWLAQLGPLTTPGWPTYFATTCPRWQEGRIDATPEELEAIFQDVSEHSAFTSRFGPDSESLRAMFLRGGNPDGDGGVSHLLEKLIRQVRESRTAQLLDQRKQDNIDQACALLNEALPLDNFEQRRSELLAWKQAIKDGIQKFREQDPGGDPAMPVSILLRQILNVDPLLLEPIPLQCAGAHIGLYIGRQFAARWLQSRWRDSTDLSSIGLKDRASTERLLGYLCDHALRDGSVAQWVQRELGQITDHEEADYARRFLATKMGDALCFGTFGRGPHRPVTSRTGGPTAETVIARLAAYGVAEAGGGGNPNDEESPHYKGFIAPFLEHLDRVANTAAGDRPPQPGDAELRDLRSKILTKDALP